MVALGSIVREGSWLYAGCTPTGVRIRATVARYGTGDYQDPPGVREDAEAPGFAIEWERAGGGGWDGGSSTQYASIEDALVPVAEATSGTVVWKSQ